MAFSFVQHQFLCTVHTQIYLFIKSWYWKNKMIETKIRTKYVHSAMKRSRFIYFTMTLHIIRGNHSYSSKKSTTTSRMFIVFVPPYAFLYDFKLVL